MATTNRRMASFDVLKGAAIYLVVMGHVLTMCIRGIDSAVAFKLIGEIHMPVFFFISGYFSYKSTADGDFVPPKLWKRFKQLIVPFFVVSSLWILYFPHSKLQSPLSDTIPGMLTSYWKDGYWFTLTLFELTLLYALLGKILSAAGKIGWQLATIAICYLALIAATPLISDTGANFDPAGIGLLTRFFPIFIAGVFARKYAEPFKRLATSSASFPVAALTFLATWYYSVYPWEFPGLPKATAYAAQPLLHVSLMLMVFGIVYKTERPDEPQSKPSVAARWFSCLGRNSLGIYLLHYFFLFPLTVLQEPLRQLELAFLPTAAVAAFVAFFIVTAALGATFIIGKNKILSFLLIGK